ncbi:helix-turn-helix transcriptional regulator [Type-E symbiont of Plautia stali]|uniref:helix-turn-helix transcriptional regulator n=1 Tax=Type-E symbiont of Plautia stali TaxID=1560357 RepID=UPI00073EA930|nr:hypothetical protein [Type-E symbiont of Plautia stali]
MKLLDKTELAALLHIQPQSLPTTIARKPDFPQAVHPTGGQALWIESEIQAWIATQPRGNTNKRGAHMRSS